jgi:hypothetical protein
MTGAMVSAIRKQQSDDNFLGKLENGFGFVSMNKSFLKVNVDQAGQTWSQFGDPFRLGLDFEVDSKLKKGLQFGKVHLMLRFEIFSPSQG